MRRLTGLNHMEIVRAAVCVDRDVGGNPRGGGLDRESPPTRDAIELKAHRVACDDRPDGLAFPKLDGGHACERGDDPVDLSFGPGCNPDAVVMRAGARGYFREGSARHEASGKEAKYPGTEHPGTENMRQGKDHSERSDRMAYWVTVKPKGFSQTSSMERVCSGWKSNISVAVNMPTCAP